MIRYVYGMVTWVDVASLVVLVITSGATIWLAIVAASTSRSAAQTAKLALEKSESRESRDDRVAVVQKINAWADEIALHVVLGGTQTGIPSELGVHLSAVEDSEPIVDWYLEQVNALIVASPEKAERNYREAHLRATLAARARAWVAGEVFDSSSIDPTTIPHPLAPT